MSLKISETVYPLLNRSHPIIKYDLASILSATRDLWEDARNKSFFVTGGTGFFGRWLLESFAWANDMLELNASMTVLTRDPNAFKKKAPHLARRQDIDFITGDVRTFDCNPSHFTYFIHAATESSTNLAVTNPIEAVDVIVTGTKRVLDYAVQCGAEKLLYLSSGAIYGEQPADMSHISETYSGAPSLHQNKAPYGEAKRMGELLCFLYSSKYNFEVKIARCFTFIGPFLPLNAHYAVGNFIADALKGGPIVIKGNGTPYRSYLYSSDLMIWLWTILFRATSCRPYNVGSEQAITIFQLAQKVSKLFSKSIEIKVLKKAGSGRLAERYVPSTKRARDELNLKQNVSLEEALKRTILAYSLKTIRLADQDHKNQLISTTEVNAKIF